MINQNYPSKLLASAVEQFASLPGIGERTALRMVLFLLRQDKQTALRFSESIEDMVENIHFCNECFNISDTDTCDICSSNARNRSMICVVENVKDVMTIEQTQQFNGLFHVLGGIISPMEGIGPQNLNIEELVKRVEDNDIQEIILALSTTMEGDTTGFYIYKKLKHTGVNISIIARGVSFGNELEYTDEVTLGRSITNRQPFETNLKL